MQAMNCSGVRSATSFQTGLPSAFAQRSQAAFDDRGRREVDDALLRAEPAELRFVREAAARSAPISLRRSSSVTPTTSGESARTAAQHDLVAAAEGEGHAVAAQVAVRFQHDVGRRVVGVGVHGVGAGEGARGRGADVPDDEVCDASQLVPPGYLVLTPRSMNRRGMTIRPSMMRKNQGAT